MYPKQFIALIESLKILPSIGQKSATRMAFYLLEKNPKGAKNLIEQLRINLENMRHCTLCRTLTDQVICEICADTSRDKTRLCVVEHTADFHALEQLNIFNGYYYILHGYLSPLDGLGPDELGLDQLRQQILAAEVKELILATNPTVEGNATAFYIQEIMHDLKDLKISRIAHGVPVGSSIENLDGGTLFHAFNARQNL
ncbi:recombination protein RecR [Gammaproteobacteria bacterium]|nr:recombination protein RecR [Gammaproteobacteria bacterium]